MKIKLTKDHKYKIGKEEYISVTTFVKQFFQEFDDKAIAKKLSQIPKFKKEKKGYRYWLKKWKFSREQGTVVHKEIEAYLNKGIQPKHPKAISATKFLNQEKIFLKDAVSELLVYSNEYKIAGTVDLVYTKDKKIYILDWKTNEEIKMEGYKGKKGIGACKDVVDSNFWHYVLQLNLYSYLLEEVYCKPIDSMKLIHLGEDFYSTYVIPKMYDVVEKMLEERK
jgi:ATP-dependent exoDNAse (exonuclease V) beta subunit